MYLEVRASCSAFSSSACRACSTSWFLRSTSAFCVGQQLGFLFQLLVGLLQLLLLALQLVGQRLGLLSSSSVRLLASMVFSTIPMLSVSWSRNARWVSLKRSKEASSMTALTSPSNRTGSTTMLSGVASPRPELIWT